MTKPDFVILEGAIVRLVPLVPERDSAGLYEASCGDAIDWDSRKVSSYDSNATIWRYLFDGPFGSVDDMLAATRRRVNADRALCFCVQDVASGRPVGMANLASNFPEHLRIELGGIWLSPVVRGTGAGTELVWLMLTHLFSQGYRRIEWKCDKRNTTSRTVAEKLGFVFEGVQDSHMIVKGESRDTMWFRMLACEWPDNEVKIRKMIEERRK